MWAAVHMKKSRIKIPSRQVRDDGNSSRCAQPIPKQVPHTQGRWAMLKTQVGVELPSRAGVLMRGSPENKDWTHAICV